VFGRLPTEAELAAGMAYLAKEPMRSYEERKAESAKAQTVDEKKKASESGAEKKPDGDEEQEMMTGDGMMGGVVPGAGKKDQPKPLPVTPLGRYMKVLLSSSEFLFVN
jgi:hypothetical protein